VLITTSLDSRKPPPRLGGIALPSIPDISWQYLTFCTLVNVRSLEAESGYVGGKLRGGRSGKVCGSANADPRMRSNH